MNPAKTAKLIEMVLKWGGEQTCAGARNHVLDGDAPGASWQIRLSDSCAATARPFAIILTTIDHFDHYLDLQCFDAVGWLAGRASGL